PYEGTFKVRIDHPDYVRQDPVDVAVKEFETFQDFNLKPALAISGTVLDPDGKPAPDVLVQAWLGGGGPLVETKTASGGTYNLSRLEAGPYRMRARAQAGDLLSEFQNEVAAGSQGVDFRLITGGRIEGVVTDPGGAPIASYEVNLRPLGPKREPGR